MAQYEGLGSLESPSWNSRIEYYLAQLLLGNGTDYTALLTQIHQAVDGLEFSVDNIDLSNAQIEMNTDDVEGLINSAIILLQSIDSEANSIMISSSEIKTSVDGLEALTTAGNSLLNTISTSVDGLETLTAQVVNGIATVNANVDTVEGLLGSANAIANSTNAIEDSLLQNFLAFIDNPGSRLDLMKQALDAILAVLQSIEILTASLQIPILSIMQSAINIEQILLRKSVCVYSKTFDAAPFNVNAGGQSLNISPIADGFDPCDKMTITNITGEGTTSGPGFPNTQLWLFGKYYISGLPITGATRQDYDFVVKPGETLELLSGQGFIANADGDPSGYGNIVVTAFRNQ